MTPIDGHYYVCFVPAPYCQYAIMHYSSSHAAACSFYKADRVNVSFFHELNPDLLDSLKFPHNIDTYFFLNPSCLREFGISPYDCKLEVDLTTDYPELFI